ncbi:MAG TPA: universal stress protein [Bacteroidia bacterium]|jgi:nucleotide-binding universal stress UspA family protein|nr:universal stress protein [Bacteroidia bacterium]
MKTILVPTDFSEAARNASEYAVAYAKEFAYKLLLCHIYHLPVMSVPEEPLLVLESPKVLRKNQLESLNEEADLLTKNTAVPIECRVSEGFAVDEILDIEKETQPEFIVMGMETEGAFSELIIGSIATDVIRKTKSPILLVPEKAKFKKINKITLAYDYNLKQDVETLAPLRALIKQSNAQLCILNVGKVDFEKDAEKAIAGIKLEKYFEGIPYSTHFTENEDFTAAVNNFIESSATDLIVMIPHKHSFLERLFKESHTKKIAFHTNIPLLTLPELKS